MKSVYLFMLFIGDPLMVAFISSVIIGAFFKEVKSALFVKRLCSVAAFWLYFGLGAAAYFLFSDTGKLIVMLAPITLIVITIIVSVIVAPKGEVKKNIDKEYKLTGWDTMFPNDLDNYDKTSK